MRKTDLIKELSNQSNLPQSETKLVIDTLELFLTRTLREQNDKIKLGIGYFYKTTNGQPKFSPSPKFTKQVKENQTDEGNSSKTTVQPSNSSTSKQTKGVRKNALRR